MNEARYLGACALLAALGGILTWWGWRGRVPKHRMDPWEKER